jgi:hypothetical protein
MQHKLIYEPAYGIGENSTGGNKRSFQIHKLLQENFELTKSKEYSFGFESRFKRYTKGFKFLFKNKAKFWRVNEITKAGYLYTNIEKIVKSQPEINCYVWECTVADYFYKSSIYHDLGLKMVIFPHNLESLVIDACSPISNKKAPHWFDEELKILKKCKHVFTISKEESWLLTLHGIPSTYFPYYPSEKNERHLKSIRSFRENNPSQDFFLIFGSFFYPPIRKGMIELIEFIINNKLGYNFKIAGFSSEEITTLYKYLPSNIEIVGTASEEQLLALMKNCKAVIINQQASSGALTKITELQIAGVPIIANEPSLRSYCISKGCYSFNSINELNTILNNKFVMPELPESIEKYEKRVVEIIDQIISNPL